MEMTNMQHMILFLTVLFINVWARKTVLFRCVSLHLLFELFASLSNIFLLLRGTFNCRYLYYYITPLFYQYWRSENTPYGVKITIKLRFFGSVGDNATLLLAEGYRLYII